MISISTIFQFLTGRRREMPKRHHYAPPPRKSFDVPEHYRSECVGGEWWLLTSDGKRIVSFGTDAAKCQTTLRNMNRSAAQIPAIRAHVRKHFKHVPLSQ